MQDNSPSYISVSVYPYISGGGEDLREDDPGQAVSAVVQSCYGKLQHSILVLYGAQIQQAADIATTETGEKLSLNQLIFIKRTNILRLHWNDLCSLTTGTGHISLTF